MRNKSKLKITIIVIGIVFAFLSIKNYNVFNDQDGTIEIGDETNLRKLKRSGYWTTTFIHIDGNWSATASAYDWCSGDGSWGNPYTIENVTIDASGSPTGSGILISNSKNDYFIINNCTIYNGVSGIMLENTDRGTLSNNNCSNNSYGLWLYNGCNNNTISGNTANEDTQCGIYLDSYCDNNSVSENTANDNVNYHGILLWWYCDDNTISNNTANDNTGHGIHLREYCDNNTISGNIADGNNWNGIYFYSDCNDNTISGNTANNNTQYGIYLWLYCDNNTISGNTANNNTQNGIYLRELCVHNTISENTANDNTQNGIHLYKCDNNTISGNTADNNIWDGIDLTSSCDENNISENTANNNTQNGIHVYYDSDDNTVSGNIANNNSQNGIQLYYISDDNTISGNIANNNTFAGVRLQDNCHNNIVSENTANNNTFAGVLLENNCHNNIISGNIVNNNDHYGICLWFNCDNTRISENYIYFNTNWAIIIILADCDNTIIIKNVLVSEDERFIDDDGTNTVISMNYELLSPPQLYVEIVDQLFSITEFTIIINVFSEFRLDFSIQNIQMWWNRISVPSDNITELGNGLYNVSLTPIFVVSDEDPILLNMTISAAHHMDKYFETYIAVEPPEIAKLLQVEITEHSYSLEHFNLTFFVYDEIKLGIDSATVQVWWNGVDVSVNVQNQGEGLYFLSLNPITVAPGEDPILLTIIISADGYQDKAFETYIAVDPDTLDKDGVEPAEELPLIIIIVAITSIAGGIGVAGVALILLRKRKRTREVK